MRSMKTSCGLVAALLLGLAVPSAEAGSLRTWVAKTGNASDDNPCSRKEPCYTFGVALAKTDVGGEITVLDPGGYGGMTITKSVTINGTLGSGYGSILQAGIVIDMAPDDPFKTVRLNWLDLNGASKWGHGIRIRDTQGAAGVSVVIENTNIDGYTGSGILDERSLGGKLVIANTVVRHTGESGILIGAVKSNGTVRAALSNVRVHNSAHAALSVYGGAKVMVSNSVFSGSSFGIDVETPGTEMLVDGSTITGNQSVALYTFNSGVLKVSNSEVSFNGTDVSGPVESFTSNRFIGNGAGGPVTPIGQPTSATGLR